MTPKQQKALLEAVAILLEPRIVGIEGNIRRLRDNAHGYERMYLEREIDTLLDEKNKLTYLQQDLRGAE